MPSFHFAPAPTAEPSQYHTQPHGIVTNTMVYALFIRPELANCVWAHAFRMLLFTWNIIKNVRSLINCCFTFWWALFLCGPFSTASHCSVSFQAKHTEKEMPFYCCIFAFANFHFITSPIQWEHKVKYSLFQRNGWEKKKHTETETYKPNKTAYVPAI